MLHDVARWSEYQDEVAEFFVALGLSASVNETVEGVRTKHDIDVVVRSRHAGIDVIWLVECKAWKRRVPKEKVFAFREIVKDVGADRGFLMAEEGYQSGAVEATRFTNVTVSSLGELRTTLADELGLQDLKVLGARVESCRERYWNIGKEDRIAHGLRPDVGFSGYSGPVVMDAVSFAVRNALLNGFPITYQRSMCALAAVTDGARLPAIPGVPEIATPQDLYAVLDAELTELEGRLELAEVNLLELAANPRGLE